MNIRLNIKPIPKEAMPAVEFLRREVRRPAGPPSSYARFCAEFNGSGFGSYAAMCCPFGLHRNASSSIPTPHEAARRHGLSIDAVRSFMIWWDAEASIDGRAAMDAVWPPESES